MKKTCKKSLALVLCLMMMLASVPFGASAAGECDLSYENELGFKFECFYGIDGSENTAAFVGFNSETVDKKTITTVVVPETITAEGKTFTVIIIRPYAFSNMASLTKITIPNSVESIEYGATRDATALEEIIYKGTNSQWGSITIEDKNDALKSATITYHTECTFGEWTTTKEATATEDGEKTRTCTVCGDVETEVIKATGEVGGDTETDQDEPQEENESIFSSVFNFWKMITDFFNSIIDMFRSIGDNS